MTSIDEQEDVSRAIKAAKNVPPMAQTAIDSSYRDSVAAVPAPAAKEDAWDANLEFAAKAEDARLRQDEEARALNAKAVEMERETLQQEAEAKARAEADATVAAAAADAQAKADADADGIAAEMQRARLQQEAEAKARAEADATVAAAAAAVAARSAAAPAVPLSAEPIEALDDDNVHVEHEDDIFKDTN
jgi:hypothetical protein